MLLAKSLLTFLRPVHDDSGALQGDQSSTDHLIQLREDRLDLLLGVDALDDQRKVEREPEDLLRVDSRASPESHDATEHRCTGEVTLAQEVNDSLVERFPVVLVPLTDMDAHEHPF